MKVSILILSFNEAINLPRCLSALNWCDDIVVIDSGSTDDSVEIAQSFGATILHRAFDNFANQRNFGLENHAYKHEWVLHLDADEVVTPEFIAALERLQETPGIDAYNVPAKMMLFGAWIKHAGMWPTYQVRLGHRERLRFIQVGHGQREDLPAEKVGTFTEPYLHYSFSHGMQRWLEKHVKYARDEADLLLSYRQAENSKDSDADSGTSGRRKAKQASARIPFILRPMARFVYVYLFRGGFRDGRRGLAYALMLSVYEGMTAIFAYEKLFKSDT